MIWPKTSHSEEGSWPRSNPPCRAWDFGSRESGGINCNHSPIYKCSDQWEPLWSGFQGSMGHIWLEAQHFCSKV